jgi:hypothetical protein
MRRHDWWRRARLLGFALAALVAIALIIRGAVMPASADSLRVTIGEIRSDAGTLMLLAEQVAIQHVTATFVDGQGRELQKTLRASRDDLETMSVAARLEPAKERALDAASKVDALLTQLARDPAARPLQIMIGARALWTALSEIEAGLQQ